MRYIVTTHSNGDVMQTFIDVEGFWQGRLARVQRSQTRTDPSGMTRPPRDPSERAFLARIGQLGPFVESQSSSLSVSTSQSSDIV